MRLGGEAGTPDLLNLVVCGLAEGGDAGVAKVRDMCRTRPKRASGNYLMSGSLNSLLPDGPLGPDQKRTVPDRAANPQPTDRKFGPEAVSEPGSNRLE